MSKIAIYGGAFNPPTLGHYHIIEQIFKNSSIEKIIIVPDGVRLDKEYFINKEDRFELINIFIKELNQKGYNIELNNHFFEGKNDSDTTTYEVDKYFINKLGFEPYHVFGTDISGGIKNWSGNPNKYVEKKVKKIFVPRGGSIFNDYDLENYELLNTDSQTDISSTKVRNNIANNKNINKFVSIEIKEYIIERNLYK
ncbi:MAG: adenylyltransferase/cytidyltransferase family protein [Candidatus Gracilibacteria bacterium]